MPRASRVKQEPEGTAAVPIGAEGQADDVQDTADVCDEIAREIAVFLSPALQSQLHLMQFPLQHQHVPQPDAVRVRPRHGMLQLDQRIPPNVGLDGGYDLPHRTHASHTIPVSTHMALGKFEYSADATTAALHLVPLSHITQLRPIFSHVRDTDTAPNATAGSDEDEEEEGNQKRKPVMFQKKETERAAMVRKSSYAYKCNSEESEEWLELAVQTPQSQAYRQLQQSIACPAPSNDLLLSTESGGGDVAGAFVHSLNYLPGEDDQLSHAVHDVDQPVVGAETDRPSSLLVQICLKLTKMLHRGWPVPYSVIRAQFPSSVDDVDILSALSSCAVLVRGNFALQSRLLPLPSSDMAQARTFLLYLLQTFGNVQRARLSHVYGDDTTISPEMILVLLEQVADKTSNGWRLKVDDDAGVYERFPEQAQLHAQFWDRQAIRYAKQLKEYAEAILIW